MPHPAPHPAPHGGHHAGPHHRPHRHMAWDFPAPSHDELIEAFDGDEELAYVAMLALQNCPSEMRVLAHLLLRRSAPDVPPMSIAP